MLQIPYLSNVLLLLRCLLLSSITNRFTNVDYARFKATPQQIYLNEKGESSNGDSCEVVDDVISDNGSVCNSENDHDNNGDNHHDENSSNEDDDDDEVPKNDSEQKKQSILKRPPVTEIDSQELKRRKTKEGSNESIPVTTECLNNLQTAAFLAQAAAVATVAALSSGPLIPIFPSETPPIAPLGLSLPTLGNGNFTTTTTTTTMTMTGNAENVSNNFTSNQTKIESTLNSKTSSSANTSKNTDTDDGDDEDDGEGDDNENNQFKGREREKQFINCPVCCKTMRRGSLREHMDRHANSGKFKCDICEKTFSRASARAKHIRTHTGERPYKCELCSKAYRQKVHLNEHFRSHTGARPYLCKLCGFCLASKSLLNRHLRTHGVKKNLDNDSDVWMKIDASREEALNIAAEVGRVLSQKQNNISDNSHNDNSSGSGSGSSSNLQSLKNEKSVSNSFACDFLQQLTPKGSITFGRKYLCNLCPAGFPTVQALRSHRMTTHNVVTPHKCPQCNESFSALKSMEEHLRKIHPQVCPICSKQMPERRRWMVDAHIREAHPDAGQIIGPYSKNFRKIRPKEPISSSDVTNAGTVNTVVVTASDAKNNSVNCSSSELRKWQYFRPDKVHSSSDDDEEDLDDNDVEEEEEQEEEQEVEEERESDFDRKSSKTSNGELLDENTSTYSIDPEHLEENSLLGHPKDDGKPNLSDSLIFSSSPTVFHSPFIIKRSPGHY
ncbi:unnamed protein product [Heterobilharzia americana]|nr:unnamed protein product [Heterobilharzia americana]